MIVFILAKFMQSKSLCWNFRYDLSNTIFLHKQLAWKILQCGVDSKNSGLVLELFAYKKRSGISIFCANYNKEVQLQPLLSDRINANKNAYSRFFSWKSYQLLHNVEPWQVFIGNL